MVTKTVVYILGLNTGREVNFAASLGLGAADIGRNHGPLEAVGVWFIHIGQVGASTWRHKASAKRRRIEEGYLAAVHLGSLIRCETDWYLQPFPTPEMRW